MKPNEIDEVINSPIGQIMFMVGLEMVNLGRITKVEDKKTHLLKIAAFQRTLEDLWPEEVEKVKVAMDCAVNNEKEQKESTTDEENESTAQSSS